MAGCSTGSDAPQSAQPGKPAPDFNLPGLDGQVVSLSNFRGRPVMLNFWASWCDPCKLEMPFIQGIFEDEEFAGEELVVLTVNIGESAETARKFAENYRLSFPVLLDGDGEVASIYDVRGIPATFFVGENGIIEDMKIGTFTSKAEIEWRLVNSIVSIE
jgi:peroxiredoxin